MLGCSGIGVALHTVLLSPWHNAQLSSHVRGEQLQRV